MKNKTTPLFLCIGSLLILGCAKDPVAGAYQKALATVGPGMVSYHSPIGDPAKSSDWESYGPGTVIDRKQQSRYLRSSAVIGDDGVRLAMDKGRATPIHPFGSQRYSGSDFDGSGGWSLQGIGDIAASLKNKKLTAVELTFGPTWLSSPFDQSTLHGKVKEAGENKIFDSRAIKFLRKGPFQLVQNVIWCESLRYTFKQTNETGGSTSYKLGPEAIANLKASGYQADSGGITLDQPSFIAYLPLDDVKGDLPR